MRQKVDGQVTDSLFTDEIAWLSDFVCGGLVVVGGCTAGQLTDKAGGRSDSAEFAVIRSRFPRHSLEMILKCVATDSTVALLLFHRVTANQVVRDEGTV